MFSTPTFWLANSGMNLATGSASRSWPSSTSIMMPTETIGLVIEKMRKMVSWAIGRLSAGLCRPMRVEPADLALARDHHGDAGQGSLVDLALERVRQLLQSGRRQPDASPAWPAGSGGVCGLAACFGGGLRVHGLSPECSCLAWVKSGAEVVGLNSAFAAASPLQIGHGLCLKRRGSPALLRSHRSVAQLVEHRSPKPGVAGSSPATPASRPSPAKPLISRPVRP